MEEIKTTEKSSKSLITGASIALVVLIIVGVVFYGQKEVVAPVNTNNETINTEVPTETSLYKDGTYSSKGVYASPGGAEQIGVQLTLKNGVVTDATVVSEATLPASKQFQAQFISGFKAVVIGKNISTLSLDKVSGSSLTPKGFNDAVAKIKVQAQS